MVRKGSEFKSVKLLTHLLGVWGPSDEDLKKQTHYLLGTLRKRQHESRIWNESVSMATAFHEPTGPLRRQQNIVSPLGQKSNLSCTYETCGYWGNHVLVKVPSPSDTRKERISVSRDPQTSLQLTVSFVLTDFRPGSSCFMPHTLSFFVRPWWSLVLCGRRNRLHCYSLSGAARFESLPGHPISLLRSSTAFLSPYRQTPR
jgi:hypothetical protein